MNITYLKRKLMLPALGMVCGLLVCLQTRGIAADSGPLRIELTPSQNAGELAVAAKELSKVLKKALGMPVQVSIAKDYATAVEDITTGRVDLSYLHPVSYVHASKDGKAGIIVKSQWHGRSSYTARFFVLKTSGFKTLDQLRGKKIAFVDRLSSSGYVYPMVMLIKSGFIEKNDPNTFFGGGSFTDSHDAALNALLKGAVDVAVSFDLAPAQYLKKEEAEKITYIAETPPIVEAGICARQGLSPELVEKVKTAFLGLSKKSNPRLMKKLYNIDGFSPAQDSEYAPVRDSVTLLGGNTQ